MSAQSVLAGLMPPLENKNVLPIPWQPVAINTLARNDDIVSSLIPIMIALFELYFLLQLLAQKKTCIKYENILQKLYKNPPLELEKLNEENKALFKLLSKNTGKVNRKPKRIL